MLDMEEHQSYLLVLQAGKKNKEIMISYLSKSCIEQIEEEGGSAEIEAQLINKGRNFNDITIEAKVEILNFYIDWCYRGSW
ncbi:MAG: hypothetical protein EZS28_046335 [Streblomastix strix]|uniref:Uncharacterized protein n=1 Tax=Streblomastix strix TaxID=222440 RepID=A0A5J4TIP6_9EUKA|nr:MAG: hypothetical protein EZS28_046335 [Streblomastix strix]